VTDPKKICVLALPTIEPMTWRWKVFLPKGGWRLHAVTNVISEINFDASGTGTSLTLFEEKQLLVEAGVRKGANDEWVFAIRTPNSTSQLNISGHPYVRGNSSSIWSSAGALEEMLDPDKPADLLRLRCMKTVPNSSGGTSSQQPKGPCDGFHIWIERDKAAAVVAPAPAATSAASPPNRVAPASPALDSD
jgi:hypothetical protein